MIIQFGGKPTGGHDALLQEPGSIPPGETVINVSEVVEDFTRRVPAPVRIIAGRVIPGLVVAGIVTLISVGLHSCAGRDDPPLRTALAPAAPVTITVAAEPSPVAPTAAAESSTYVAPDNPTSAPCDPLPPSGGVAAAVDSCGHDTAPEAGSVDDSGGGSGLNLLQRILGWAGGALGWLARLLTGGH